MIDLVNMCCLVIQDSNAMCLSGFSKKWEPRGGKAIVKNQNAKAGSLE